MSLGWVALRRATQYDKKQETVVLSTSLDGDHLEE